MRRERRNKLAGVELGKPIFDIALLGTEDDPCFGKGYELTNEICIGCGDIEACAAVFSQNQIKVRLEFERDDHDLDLKIDKLELHKQQMEFIKYQFEVTTNRLLIINRVRARFKLQKEGAVNLVAEFINKK
jgi:hypothetical protein